jgi:riboflavin kinase/FMN adenylyltransferase
VIGYDHGFGRGRSGDADTLREIGRDLGFAVDVVGPVELGGASISSTRIRAAVQDARLDDARAGLGRPYAFRGVVVRGEGRGRALGFPTANLRVGSPDKLLPPPGVYAVRGVLPGGKAAAGTVPGALHIGPRPTFQGSPPSVELHLIDFEGDLYGEVVRVDLVRRLREIQPFGSPEALVAQLARDVEEARRVLEADA